MLSHSMYVLRAQCSALTEYVQRTLESLLERAPLEDEKRDRARGGGALSPVVKSLPVGTTLPILSAYYTLYHRQQQLNNHHLNRQWVV